MSDHLIAEADRHAKALPTTNPTHADIAWYVREVSELRAILASIEEDGTEEHNAAVSLRQELATERARLDWLMAGGVCMVQHSGGFYVSRLHAQVSRAVIDAAMKEGA